MSAISRTDNSSYQVVSYSSANNIIVPSTSNFTLSAQALAEYKYSNDKSAVLGGPIVFCDSKLRREKRYTKVVLFSSGLNNLGGDPVRRANIFKERTKGEIFVLSIGGKNIETLKQIASNEEDFISIENDSWSVQKKIVIALVQKLCKPFEA